MHDVPSSVLDLVGAQASWELASGELASGGLVSAGTQLRGDEQRVWLSSDHAVKWAAPARLVRLAHEARNLRWLNGRAGAPTLVEFVEDATGGWLVTTRANGVPGHRVDRHGNAEAVAHGAAEALAELHALSPAGAPFPGGWDGVASSIQRSIDAGEVRAADLPAPYDRYELHELQSIWERGRPFDEDLVVCHGAPYLSNLVLHQDQARAWVDLGVMRAADRHWDLAITQRSLIEHLGADAVFLFVETYERVADTRIDVLRLDHYQLGSLLV